MLIDVIKQMPNITQAGIQSEMGISRTCVQRMMKELQAEGMIERVGSKKTGYWKVNEGKD
ncbi:MarR family transcriptional regulator [Anaerovorax odorimutans]|uniref:MarR family transcriptional regulator n=1 Tax=Anaerovorax odorimutans TaxID=109327 RepID=A0ABT1RMK8_9FIRM|nr:MarR family transcriptional regulator [Anaerovorax odorimutans]